MDTAPKSSFLERFLQLDRRIIYTLVALAVAFPLIWPIGLPIRITPEVQSVFDTIENLPEGSTSIRKAVYCAQHDHGASAPDGPLRATRGTAATKGSRARRQLLSICISVKPNTRSWNAWKLPSATSRPITQVQVFSRP